MDNLGKVCSTVFRGWEWTSNGSRCNKGTRIITGWDSSVIDVMVIAQTDQIMHLQIMFKNDKKILFCSVVYAANYYFTRRELWHQLNIHKVFVGDRSWVILGDFNSALNLEDKSMGVSHVSIGMREFQECVANIEMFDINRSGFQFTWNQKPKKGVGLLKKIERVMGNTPFVAEFPNSIAFFHPYRMSDHCPSLLKIPSACKSKRKAFEFANFLIHKSGFSDIVKNIWDTNIDGVDQFRVFKKLKLLKGPLRNFMFQQGNLHKKVDNLRGKLDFIQWEIDSDPMNAELRSQETKINAEFLEACLDEERFLRQKSKVDWLKAGDTITKFFHATLKSRNHLSRIDVIMNSNGVLMEGEDVHKTLGFFDTGKLLREINNTLIVLIPKKSTPMLVTDYRPIACCNVIYKCISKIVADRIKGALSRIVSINQSAFVPGRKISDNILLTQELMHNYHRDHGPPRCAFKVDIQKAYDTVDWRFLKDVLIGFGFDNKMVDWIMSCVTTTSYSICVNGDVHGYFRGSRGLRQGDPLSPYLFTLVMEVLTCILKQNATLDLSFRFHNRCGKQQIINLCFAYDLFLFARGDVSSASCIMRSLTTFTNMSGLVPSIQKSTAFFVTWPHSVLVEKLDNRIMNWQNRFLSFAGRLQLISSVLSAMHIYWSSVFILPARIIKELEAKMLKGRSFWVCKEVANCCWSWKKLLQLRPIVRNHIWTRLGDGSRTSAWYDTWSNLGPLSNILTPRAISNAGFELGAKVKDVHETGSWSWSMAWRDLYPVLIQLDQISLNPGMRDQICWKEGNKLLDFSSSNVWHSIWNKVRHKVCMNSVESKWSAIMNWLLDRARSKSATSYVSRLLVATVAYFIWQERNARLFKNQTRPPDTICELIVKTIRYKLMGVKFKDCAKVRRMLGDWDIGGTGDIDDGS
ncbi:uncharacterized protein LOC110942475 [Helianthus annuus]|uniref:uncharacterized protein LOC110942475 n=1 Tax=Helianthus annuus TaxID=4232 RepID=UPI000B8FBC97|nr:uncharacterized protein LOC110942475 [Helianthus annuus]